MQFLLTSCVLACFKLKSFSYLTTFPSMFVTGKEKSLSSSSKDQSQQEVLFLRSITLSTDSVSPQGAERIVLMALDELDRAQLDPRVSWWHFTSRCVKFREA